MAGNVSETKVRGIIFSNFLEAVGTKVVDADGNSTVFYGAAAVNVAQNGSVVAALGNFTVTTSKSGSNPLLDRYLVQSVYYNDKLISSDQKYDPSTLENLDTSTPGVYKIVYILTTQNHDALCKTLAVRKTIRSTSTRSAEGTIICNALVRADRILNSVAISEIMESNPYISSIEQAEDNDLG